MYKILISVLFSIFLIGNLSAGCMKGEINQIDAKLKESNLSQAKKDQITEIRNIIAANENKDSELAFRSYERAMSILN